MNVTKLNPVGIDLHIQRFNKFLNEKIKLLWRVDDADFIIYGRSYKNQTSDGLTPEIYVGNGEYKDLYWDDKLKMLSFWEVQERRTIQGASIMSECNLIMMVNVKKIKPSTERKDEEIREDIEKLCLSTIEGFELNGYCTGIDAVFEEYSGWKVQTGMKFRDMYPYHCFKLNFKILYPIYNN